MRCSMSVLKILFLKIHLKNIEIMQKPTTHLGLILISCLLFNVTKSFSQQCSSGFLSNGAACGGPIRTAVPFLLINPDARSGAMGDVGLATTPDATALHFNASKLAFSDKKFGATVSYTPWLRNLGVNDIFLGYDAFYLQLGKEKQHTLGLSHRYFSLGSLDWTDANGNSLGFGTPREQEVALTYAKKITPNFALGLTAKYINSNLATDQTIGIDPIKTGESVAVDVSMTYHKPLKIKDLESDLTFGLVIKNMGTKISYLRSEDFLPTNLGIGAAWKTQLHPAHSITLALDFNKLLVPTPDSTGAWRNKSVVGGMLSSFGDAPGGFSEELQEINVSVGLEYWFMQYVAARGGIFIEPDGKGGRKYFTTGLGLRYKWFNLNASYLIQKNILRGPLDNTFRFTLTINPADFKKRDI
jgi:Type IX secretion system protein PorV